MQEETRLYQCQGGCKTIVEVLYSRGDGLTCCGQPMQPLKTQTEGEKAPTHKPVVEETENGIKVQVGEVPHAMDDTHYIAWIEAEAGGNVLRHMLSPGDRPEAEFPIKNPDSVRAFCTTHGFWETKKL